MLRPYLLRSLVLCAALTAGGRTAEAQPATATPTFRAGVDLVPLTAVVRDGRGRTMRGLQPQDFLVLERGRPRRIANFKAGDQGPVSLAILMDTSGSMRVGRQLAASRDAIEHVLSWIDSSTDEIGLFLFDQTLRLEVPFTKDPARIRDGMARLDGMGTTSLYDAIALTAKALDERPSPRRAVIVVTDGVDNSSTMTAARVSGLASAIDVPVYVIALLSPLDHPGTEYAVPSSIGSVVETQLANLCAWTGGDLIMASAPAHVSAAVRDLLTQLRHQYVLTFEAAAEAGWYDFEVRVDTRMPSFGRGAAISRAAPDQPFQTVAPNAAQVREAGPLEPRPACSSGEDAKRNGPFPFTRTDRITLAATKVIGRLDRTKVPPARRLAGSPRTSPCSVQDPASSFLAAARWLPAGRSRMSRRDWPSRTSRSSSHLQDGHAPSPGRSTSRRR